MDEKKLFSDVILELGEDFQVDAMDDFHERVNSGEFDGKTDEEIRNIYFEEALQAEQDEELREHFQIINAMEEAEEDAQDFHIQVEDEDLADFDGEDEDEDLADFDGEDEEEEDK